MWASGDQVRPEPCSAAGDCKRACMADQQSRLQWTCEQCTFINDRDGPSCEACSSARPNQGAPAQQSLVPCAFSCNIAREGRLLQPAAAHCTGGVSSTPGRWQCEHCTMHNSGGARHCHMCHRTRGVPRSMEVVELLDDDDDDVYIVEARLRPEKNPFGRKLSSAWAQLCVLICPF